MTLFKPSSITLFFAAKPSIIAKKRKPQVSEIKADEGPDEAGIVADNAATKKDSCLVDVIFVVDGVGVFISLHFAANPTAKVDPVRKFASNFSAANEYWVYNEDAMGMFYIATIGCEAPDFLLGRMNVWLCGHWPEANGPRTPLWMAGRLAEWPVAGHMKPPKNH